MSYPHDSTLTKSFVVKITVEKCDKFFVAVPQIFDMVKSVALWSAKKKKRTIKGYGSAAKKPESWGSKVFTWRKQILK